MTLAVHVLMPFTVALFTATWEGAVLRSVFAALPWRSGLIVVVTVSALLTLSLAMTRPAYAGDNGQQIRFNCSPGLKNVSITGTNQDGNRATWTGGTDPGEQVTTDGWWWVGSVTIKYQTLEGSVTNWVSRTKTDSVPTGQFLNNWYDIDCQS